MRSSPENEKHKESLLEFLPIGLALCQMDGSFVTVNSAFVKIVKREVEELLNLTIQEITPEKYFEQENVLMQSLKQTGEYGPYEREFILKNGTLINVSLFSKLFKRNDERFIWYSAQDITEQKTVEDQVRKLLENSEKSRHVLLSVIEDEKIAREEIKQLNDVLEQRVEERTKQLKEANEELESFSYSVSHDLRAPLRAINGFTNILIKKYVAELDDEGQRLGNIIKQNSSKMGKLIDDLLSFARINRSSMSCSIIDMNTMVNSVFQESYTPEIRDRIKFSKNNLLDIYGDPTLIRQVLVNLISNAIKFSMKKEQPEITIGCSKVKGYVIYSIKDNGAGFNMKFKNKLFGVFQRLHSEQEFKGTGVGLALVQRILFRHNGEVWGEAEEGKGATFYFSLPAIKK